MQSPTSVNGDYCNAVQLVHWSVCQKLNQSQFIIVTTVRALTLEQNCQMCQDMPLFETNYA